MRERGIGEDTVVGAALFARVVPIDSLVRLTPAVMRGPMGAALAPQAP